MKTLGILGGIGPESTVEYYRLLIAAYRERKGDGSSPSILIHSIDVKRLLDFAAAAAPADLIAYLAGAIEVLILGGTELPLILKDPVVGGVPALDTTRIHVDAAVARLLAAEAAGPGG